MDEEKLKISNKLLEFQKRVSAISKDSVNPFFKSKYFDINTVIDTIKPILNELGLVITQGFDHSNGQNIIVTRVMDGNECLAISEMIVPHQEEVQKLGAAITYCRRYSLVSLLLLQGEEDDDANKVLGKITMPLKTPNISSQGLSQNISSHKTPGLSQNTYEKLLQEIKNSKTEKELDATAENLKYYKKQVSATQYTGLRNAGKAKRAELTGEIVIEQEDLP